MSPETELLPPCIVLGLETQIGLNIVRELGRAGVRVIGIAHDPDAIGLRSRHIWRGIVVTQQRSPELAQQLRLLGHELGRCCLIAVSESNLSWLQSHPGGFGQVHPVVPSRAALEIVLDKSRTLAAATAVGIAVPQTVEPRSMAEAYAIATTFPFPGVLKWKDPGAIGPQLDRHEIPLLKSEYAYTPAEFLTIAERYEPLGVWPLLQEYCAGYGLGQFFYMHGGEAIRRFQHRRVAEWPPEGGFSSVCDDVPLTEHGDLQAQSIALLQAIGWEGVAMVEYRFDPVAKRAVLMEINGRYWGSFPLAAYCAAGFALLAYRLHSGLAVPKLPAVAEGMRCRMVGTEVKRLGRLVFQPGRIRDRNFRVRPLAEIWRFLADFFRPNVRYYVWSLGDPMPFFRDVRNALGLRTRQ